MNNRASKAGVTPDKNSTDTMTKQERLLQLIQ